MNSLTRPRATKSDLLIDESPLVLLPTLAVIIGDRRAIALQQIHYWLDLNQKAESKSGKPFHFRDGRWWTYNTYQQWHDSCFPFWTVRLIRKIFNELEDLGLVLSAQFDQHKGNSVKWYTIDYDALNKLRKDHFDPVTQNVGGLTESVTGLAESVAPNTETTDRDYPPETSLDIDKRQPSGTAAPPDQADLSEREDSQGEDEHTPLATDLNPSGPQRQTDRSKKVPPRQPWTPADGLGTDQQGWVKLPTTTQVVPKRREAVSRAKAQAVRSTQLWLVDQGIRGIEWVEEDGIDLIEHLGGTETAEEAFGRGGDLSLRKLRDLALDQSLITQKEFNAKLEEFFWDALDGEQPA